METNHFQLCALTPLLAAAVWLSPALAGCEEHISLEVAIQSALERSPHLAAGRSAVLAADARVQQAGVLPNPEIGLEVENFAGSGDFGGFDSAETTLALSQRFELGGKRSRRRDVALAERSVIGRDQQSTRLDVVARTTGDFYTLLAAQRRLLLAEDLLRLSERLSTTVDARVSAGKVSPVESSRVQVPVVMAKVEVAKASRRLDAARTRLESNWGGYGGDLVADGDLLVVVLPPPLDSLIEAALTTPAMERLADLVQHGSQELRYQKSLRVPDLVVAAGTRRFAESDERAWVAGVNITLPIFDDNKGGRQATELELERSRHLLKAAESDLRAEVADATAVVRAAYAEASLIGGEAVPASQTALTAAEIGYKEGKLELLAVLDSQRAFFEAQMLHIEALERYHLAKASLERLVGSPLALIDHSAPSAPADSDTRSSE